MERNPSTNGTEPRRSTHPGRRAAALLCVLCLVAALAPSARAADPLLSGGEIRYQISPRAWGDEERSLHVVLTFVGEADGTTVLALPDQWGGARDLGRAIQGLRARTAEASIEASPQGKKAVVVTHPPLRPVQVEYEVVQDEPSSPLTAARLNRPVLRLGWFYVIGQALFVIPEWDRDAQRELVITWSGLPSGWTLVGPWGEGPGEKAARGDIGDLLGATFIGGIDLRHSRRIEAGYEVSLVTRGHWAFPEEDLLELWHEIIDGQRRMLDKGAPLSATLIALQTDEYVSNLDGEARTGGVSLYLPQELGAAQEAAFLLAHETFHLCNARQIGPPAHPRLAWFSEGVADWFAARTLQETGLWDEGRTIEWLNGVLREYSMSPARSLSVEQMMAERASSHEAARLPDRQGALLASNWDADMRRISGGALSLESVLQRLPVQREAGALGEERIAGAFPPELREGVLREVRRCVIDGGVVEPRPGAFAPRYVLVQEFLRAFEPGFDVDASLTNGVVSGVRPGSASWRAGLRDGQQWIGGGVTRDPDAWAEIVIADPRGLQRVIRYLPRAEQAQRVPQYRLPRARSPLP